MVTSNGPRSTDLLDALRAQDEAWARRPLVRRLYREWHGLIVEHLAAGQGASIELGSGIGRLREVAGERVLLTDVEKTPWADAQVDALNLPYDDASLANIVMVDVFHHLADPARFLDEAQRTLASGGRIVMIEPYCSPLSSLLYRLFHHERTDVRADPFAANRVVSRAPLESNQALPTLAFFRHRKAFERRWPGLQIVEEQRFAFVLYPLSGGFTRRVLVPLVLYRPLQLLERALAPVSPLIAFRCLVVLQKN